MNICIVYLFVHLYTFNILLYNYIHSENCKIMTAQEGRNFNLIVPNAPFLYPLKTSKNLTKTTRTTLAEKQKTIDVSVMQFV